MNNDYHLSNSDFVNMKKDINLDQGKFKNLSQKERKILKVAIESFNSGEQPVIPKTLATKLSSPSTYKKNIWSSVGKALDKVFSKNYIDSNELSNSLNALRLDDSDNQSGGLHVSLHLDDSDGESGLHVLPEADELEKEAKIYEDKADEMDIEVEKLKEEVSRLEAKLENPVEETEVQAVKVEELAVNAVQNEKPHTVFEANRAMWKMLGNAKPVEGKEEIVIAGQVLGDGRGDWAAMRNMYKILAKKFPDRPIRIIACSTEKWRDKLDVSGIQHLDLVYYGKAIYSRTEVPLKAFPEEAEILKKAEDAAVMVTAGVNINSVFESIREDLQEKSIKMDENDLNYVGNEIGNTVLQAGLNVDDNRMGIFAKSFKNEYKWSDLSNNLSSVFFSSSTPSENEIESYRSSHECFFGYTNGSESRHLFIQDAVVFAGRHSPGKQVDICIPGFFGGRIPDLENDDLKDDFEELEELGVGKVHLIFYEGGERKEMTVVLKENSDEKEWKEIRIIDPGTISNRDFKIMTNISAPIVACTGDNSLAQAISYGKIPSYERRFREKWIGLVKKIEEVQGKDSVLYRYCTMAGVNNNGKRDFSIVEAEGLAEEAKQFGEYIRNEANLKPLFKGVVNEKLIRQKDPDFAKKQDELRQKYLDNAITREELETQFTALLKEKGLL